MHERQAKMEPFDLNAIDVNVEMDQDDSPEHIVWNDGRVFDIVSRGAVVPCPSKTGPELATVQDIFIAVGRGKTTRRSLICDNGTWSIVPAKK